MNKDLQKKIDQFTIEGFQKQLINWYRDEKRELPWRESLDPYHIWVSEIMLQQTRVDTVIPYFENFITKFPTIQALAEAEEQEVLKAWEGLGYYSRARNLHSAVQEVQEHYGGVVPNNVKELERLKGVGPYTKGAILSIAYNIPEPAVDGNVMRVLSRIFSIWDDIAKVKTRKQFEELVSVIISKEYPSEFNQALMELGAMVCTPTSPACLLCPVREQCHAFYENVQHELPVKTKKKATKQVQMAAALLYDRQGYYYIHQRPSKGLLANLWEFPNVQLKEEPSFTYKKQLENFICDEYSVEITLTPLLGTIQHVFSHLTWNISVYSAEVIGSSNMKGLIKVSEEQLKAYAFPVSHQKIKKMYAENTRSE
ncbi:A/G-specific adenine glycosylase [Bacillus carboniphilus]|uniref:Adenine DNA glycosylase n=1 Tax=Bacillus carboniphilus TaxID=86663 RepID=A0ABY9JW85_9BACI|nr:A/G-specific adenine glycosylase [Bacillus carboniphilus]WLR42675.1 A/G-specific adenine glycosylase [Bacillus carboniphilus]